MFETSRKTTRPIWVNFMVLAVLLVTSGLILSACQKPVVRSKSTEAQKENHPAKVEQQKSNKQLKQKQSDKSTQKRDKDEDTQDDDDPE